MVIWMGEESSIIGEGPVLMGVVDGKPWDPWMTYLDTYTAIWISGW